MWPRFKKIVLKRMQLKESWVIFFILGVVMMNYPFINIFNKDKLLFNIPLLFLYFMVGWPISIYFIYLFTKALDLYKDGNDKKEERP